jgi:hypothetical protein
MPCGIVGDLAEAGSSGMVLFSRLEPLAWFFNASL